MELPQGLNHVQVVLAPQNNVLRATVDTVVQQIEGLDDMAPVFALVVESSIDHVHHLEKLLVGVGESGDFLKVKRGRTPSVVGCGWMLVEREKKTVVMRRGLCNSREGRIVYSPFRTFTWAEVYPFVTFLMERTMDFDIVFLVVCFSAVWCGGVIDVVMCRRWDWVTLLGLGYASVI
jgi:hypothetical protein